MCAFLCASSGYHLLDQVKYKAAATCFRAVSYSTCAGMMQTRYIAVAHCIRFFSAVYITANVSGGHLNPAVTFATCLTGHTSWAKGGLYVIAQILGGIFGSLLGVSKLLSFACLWSYTMPTCLDFSVGTASSGSRCSCCKFGCMLSVA